MLINPKEALVIKPLDEIGEEQEARGISLDKLIASGRELRQEIYEEKYASEPGD